MTDDFIHDFLQRQADPQDLSAIVHRLRLGLQQTNQSFVYVQSVSEIAVETGDLNVTGTVAPAAKTFCAPTSILPGLAATAALRTIALLHDITYGLIYGADTLADSKMWQVMNGNGLTDTQLHNINHYFVCPNGCLYVANLGIYNGTVARECFIARAPYVGGPFTIIEDFNTAAVKFGSSTSNVAISAIGFNPLVAEYVMYAIGRYSVEGKIVSGADSTWIVGADVAANGQPGNLSYGAGAWIYTTQHAGSDLAYFFELSADGSTLLASGLVADGYSQLQYHVRAATTGTTFHRTPSDNKIVKGLNNCASFVQHIGDGLLGAITSWAVDPTGQYQMCLWNATRGKSGDSGATWSEMSALPAGSWRFAYIGGLGSASRWLAAAGTSVYYTDDFGVTWTDISGDLAVVAPLADVDLALALES